MCEIFTATDRAAMISEKYDFNFERADLQDVSSAYKELYDRKMHENKQSSILLYFKPSMSNKWATVDSEHRRRYRH